MCGWRISSLWRELDWIVRSDVILLGLMLLGVVAFAIHVSYGLSRGRRDLLGDRERRQLAADLGVGVAVVRSIVVAAPYLGLMGACFGILEAFRGVGMERSAALRLISWRVAISFVTTACGILVAIAAICVCHYLSQRSELFRHESVRIVKRFPLRSRLSTLPGYALIAAPVLACLVVVYEPFFDPNRPTGFAVDLETVRGDVGGRWIVLHVTERGELFLNFEKEKWGTLSSRLAEIYSLRADRTLCLVGDGDVQYQTVMDAIDAVESAEMPDGERIRVRLITPKAMGGCPVPVHVLRLAGK